MFDWLRSIFARFNQTFAGVVQWLETFIIGVPMYVAGPSMLIIGALDSSLLSLPEINDYLVVMRVANDHKAVFYFPLFAAAGSVIGCLLLYTLLRRGGQAVLRKRFRTEHIERVERAYARFGFLALAVPALLPPPMPFKIFVATAGTLEYPRWRFMMTIMIARSLRYYIEATLAIFYGRQVIEFIKKYGFPILAVVVGACAVGLILYLIKKRLGRKTGDDAARKDVEDGRELDALAEQPAETRASDSMAD
ncbi:MAG TPA: VTT domain-containing protein [Pyrinomonadaceae bacterium]|jgi:membrane protein YqaA with SNARE-associated domain